MVLRLPAALHSGWALLASGSTNRAEREWFRAFFESLFSETEQERKAHERFLTRTLPAEVSEVSYTPSQRPRQGT